MILDPLQRTRALYRWEREELGAAQARMQIPHKSLRVYAKTFWDHKIAWNYRRTWMRCPYVEIGAGFQGCSVTSGLSHIAIRPDECNVITLLHELTHARGFGTEANPHTAGFTRMYINALSTFCRFKREDLEAQAMMRGLL